MNDRAKKERLLNEILAEETPAGFREVLLEDTLRLARRRRHFRQTRRAVSALAVVAGLALVVWRSLMPTGIPPEPSRPYVLVRTQPLPLQAVVATQPLSQMCIRDRAPPSWAICMMFYTYIIESISRPENHYIGYTSDLKQRVAGRNKFIKP